MKKEVMVLLVIGLILFSPVVSAFSFNDVITSISDFFKNLFGQKVGEDLSLKSDIGGKEELSNKEIPSKDAFPAENPNGEGIPNPEEQSHLACASNSCINGVCVPNKGPSHCIDWNVNNAESDLNCGGLPSGCAKCPGGHSCKVNKDCTTNNCDQGTCMPLPTCTDWNINHGETDLNCGGPICSPCKPGHSCKIDLDCASNSCEKGTCQNIKRFFQA